MFCQIGEKIIYYSVYYFHERKRVIDFKLIIEHFSWHFLTLTTTNHFKIVQEYERAVIFRLGRLSGGAKGPGKTQFG